MKGVVFEPEKMKSEANDQPQDPNSHQTLRVEDDLMQKLALTFPDEIRGGSKSKWSTKCCNGEKLKRMGVLLNFHVMNTLLAIIGAVCVVLFLASIVLVPLWSALVLCCWVLLKLPDKLLPQLSWLRYVWFSILFALYLAAFYADFTATALNEFISGACVSMIFFFIFTTITPCLVKFDVQLANSVTLTRSADNSDALQPNECKDRFKLPIPTDISILLLHMCMTRRLWLAVIYFAVPKFVMGVLSAAAIIVTLLLPGLAFYNGGDTAFFGYHVTFLDNPIAYSVVVISIWFIGVVGVSIVVILSVELTSCVCGDWKYEQDEAMAEEDQKDEVAISVTPEDESGTTIFIELGSTTPVAPSTASLMDSENRPGRVGDAGFQPGSCGRNLQHKHNHIVLGYNST